MNCEMEVPMLSKTVKEKDFNRVTMNANMKVSEQCRIAASKGYQVLGIIRRSTFHGQFGHFHFIIETERTDHVTFNEALNYDVTNSQKTTLM